jgi:hypothetical protein
VKNKLNPKEVISWFNLLEFQDRSATSQTI